MNPFADIENLCFVDTETRALPGFTDTEGDVRDAGTYRYMKSAFVIILTYAIGNEPVKKVALDAGFDGDWLCWPDMPEDLREFHTRVEYGDGWYAAYNMGFDRQAWNEGTFDFPHLEPEMVIDIMAQASASNLPASLEGSSQALTDEGKLPEGKELIRMFCNATGAQPYEQPEKWELFKAYAVRDTDRLREVYRRTRPLSPAEWEDYWVSEIVNERGVGIDLYYVERGAKLAAYAVADLNRQIAEWTDGDIKTVNQTKAIADYVFDRLDATGREMMVKVWDEDSEGDEDIKVAAKIGVDRGRIEKILVYLNSKEKLTNTEKLVYDLLEARQFGGSSSPKKFQKMLDQHDGGRLKGQYVFQGANQTGRFSSKGVQIQNLTRSSLGKLEARAIDMINDLEV